MRIIIVHFSASQSTFDWCPLCNHQDTSVVHNRPLMKYGADPMYLLSPHNQHQHNRHNPSHTYLRTSQRTTVQKRWWLFSWLEPHRYSLESRIVCQHSRQMLCGGGRVSTSTWLYKIDLECYNIPVSKSSYQPLANPPHSAPFSAQSCVQTSPLKYHFRLPVEVPDPPEVATTQSLNAQE